MQESVYHVLVEGGQLGPYDRRTIVGMRIRKALASGDVLVDADGRRLTVRELVRERAGDSPEPSGAVEASRGGSYSVVQGIHVARLVEVEGAACWAVPAFKGDLELRVQTRALRLEGRFRDGLAWKQDRVKLPLEQVVQARVRGTLVDLGVRADGATPMQRVTLDLLTRDAAKELAASLPQAAPWLPHPEGNSARWLAQLGNPQVWGILLGTSLLVGAILVVVWTLTHG